MSETTNHLKAKYLQCLGLSPSSTVEEIKASYKRLALLCHPDKNKSDEATIRFQELAKAYQKLTSQHDNEDEEVNAEEIFLSVFGPMFGMGVHVCPHHGPFFCSSQGSSSGIAQSVHTHSSHSHQHPLNTLNGNYHRPEEWEIDSSDEGSYDSEEEYATEEEDQRPPDRPPRPILTARSSNSLKIEWGVPCDNGSPILCYILEMEQGDVPNCNSKQIYKGNKPWYLVKNLPSDTTHHFLVRAVNNIGASGFSQLASFRTEKAALSEMKIITEETKIQSKKTNTTNMNNEHTQKPHHDDTKTKKKKKKSQTKRKKERLRKLELSQLSSNDHPDNSSEADSTEDDTNLITEHDEKQAFEYGEAVNNVVSNDDEEQFSEDNQPVEDDEEDYEMDVGETCSVYLYDLPWFTTISAIKQFFASLRIPKTGIILHNAGSSPSNRAPIDAYVTFACIEHAKQALEKDKEFMAFTKTQIQVSVKPVSRYQFDEILAHPNNAAQSIRKSVSLSSPSDGSSPPRSLSCSLWIGNVSSKVTEDHLLDLFSPFGNIQSLRLLNRTNCAFVNYSSPQEAATAKRALQGKLIGDMNVELKFSKPPKSQREGYTNTGSEASQISNIQSLSIQTNTQSHTLLPEERVSRSGVTHHSTENEMKVSAPTVSSTIETSKDSDNNMFQQKPDDDKLTLSATDADPTILDDMFPWIQGNLDGLSLEEDGITVSSGQSGMNSVNLDASLRGTQSNQQNHNDFSHLQTAFSYSLPAVDGFQLFSGLQNTMASFNNAFPTATPHTSASVPSIFYSHTDNHAVGNPSTMKKPSVENMWWQLPVNTSSGL